MRTLGPGSVSSFLKIILDVTWYALWAVMAACALGALAILLLSFNPDLIGAIEQTLAQRMGLHVGITLAAGLFAQTLYLAGILLIVENLRRIFDTLTAGDPFHPDNVARLRLTGLILAGLELGTYLFQAISMVLPGVGKVELGLNLTAWFSVVVVFVLAEVFREGARLRQEAELTI